VKTIWLQLRVRRHDQPTVAPRYSITRVSYRDADVIQDVLREVLSIDDEPIQGPVNAAIVRDDGEVEAEVEVFDPEVEVTAQILGWIAPSDVETPKAETPWEVIATAQKKRGTVELVAKFPEAGRGSGA
jgi:hypothetical protein